MAKVVNINHVGIVVHDIGKSLQFWQDILGINLEYVESIPSFNVDLAFLHIDKTRIELMKPTSTQNNEYHDLLQTSGPGFHHICLEVDDIDDMLEKLKFHNIKLKNETAIQLPGRKLAFLEPDGCDGVIVELYELN